MPKRQSIAIDQIGLAALLKAGGICVPLYQRAYSWEDKNVLEYLEDTLASMKDGSDTYFMGTVVLSESADRKSEVTDGQQRLATTAIVLSAARDVLKESGDEETAKALQESYLSKTDIRDRMAHPNITLNKIDDPIFFDYVIEGKAWSGARALRESHTRIRKAYEYAKRRVSDEYNSRKEEDRRDFILDYVEYLTDGAMVLAVRVDDSMNAFMLFETLNDRGLRAAQVDILKNYLFGRAGDNFSQVERSWSEMVDLVVSSGSEDDVLQFIKALWIGQEGPTREKELSAQIKLKVKSKRQAVDFCKKLRKEVDVYVAVMSADSSYWEAYPKAIRGHIDALNNELQLAQMLPLTLAVASHFSPEECEKAFGYLVSAAVRLLIVGGGGAGVAERAYGLAAQKVTQRKITTARALRVDLQSIVPSDSEFESSFATARVSQARLARYYLRSIENFLRGRKDSELEVIRDPKSVNLEHVLPKTISSQWSIKADEWDALVNRIGNLTLLFAKKNEKIGNDGFEGKRSALANSELLINERFLEFKSWDKATIDSRQQQLAEVARDVWSTRFD